MKVLIKANLEISLDDGAAAMSTIDCTQKLIFLLTGSGSSSNGPKPLIPKDARSIASSDEDPVICQNLTGKVNYYVIPPSEPTSPGTHWNYEVLLIGEEDTPEPSECIQSFDRTCKSWGKQAPSFNVYIQQPSEYHVYLLDREGELQYENDNQPHYVIATCIKKRTDLRTKTVGGCALAIAAVLLMALHVAGFDWQKHIFESLANILLGFPISYFFQWLTSQYDSQITVDLDQTVSRTRQFVAYTNRTVKVVNDYDEPTELLHRSNGGSR